MFLRVNQRKKNGKLHRYWSVVESRRVSSGNPAQRQVLYLGEINDGQEAAWRKTIEVFDEEKSQSCQVSLFPCDRTIPPDEANALSLVLTEMRLVRPRSFGDCWLGCVLWEELGLSQFWQKQLNDSRGAVPWDRVIQLLAINRLCEPGSEFAVHRSWFLRSAMDELLACDFAVAEKDRLYRCLSSRAAAQGCAVPAPGREVEDAVRRIVRRAAVRSDQHLLRRIMPADPQGETWLQPRRPTGLPAGGDRAGGDDGWSAFGV